MIKSLYYINNPIVTQGIFFGGQCHMGKGSFAITMSKTCTFTPCSLYIKCGTIIKNKETSLKSTLDVFTQSSSLKVKYFIFLFIFW